MKYKASYDCYGKTIAGAASGETAELSAAPTGSQSQAKGQKSTNTICYSYRQE